MYQSHSECIASLTLLHHNNVVLNHTESISLMIHHKLLAMMTVWCNSLANSMYKFELKKQIVLYTQAQTVSVVSSKFEVPCQ